MDCWETRNHDPPKLDTLHTPAIENEDILRNVTSGIITVDRKGRITSSKAVVDKEQIRQVFLNLLLNSIKSMEGGGRLTIEIHCAQDNPCGLAHAQFTAGLQLSNYIKVVFNDTGCGIEPEHLSKVFDPFFTTDPKGTGLGLAIAHKLIEENDGYIFIDSVKGNGTRAILLLPIDIKNSVKC